MGEFFPCFACGEVNDIKAYWTKNIGLGIKQVCVRCSSCGATTHFYPTEAEATAAWNLKNTTANDLRKELVHLKTLLVSFFACLDQQQALSEEDGPDEEEFLNGQLEQITEALRDASKSVV